jgi:hypothetical protein
MEYKEQVYGIRYKVHGAGNKIQGFFPCTLHLVPYTDIFNSELRTYILRTI